MHPLKNRANQEILLQIKYLWLASRANSQACPHFPGTDPAAAGLPSTKSLAPGPASCAWRTLRAPDFCVRGLDLYPKANIGVPGSLWQQVLLHCIFSFPRNIAKLLIYIERATLLKKSASQAGARHIKGLAPLGRASPQSYPQKKWIASPALTNQDLKRIPSGGLELLALTGRSRTRSSMLRAKLAEQCQQAGRPPAAGHASKRDMGMKHA